MPHTLPTLAPPREASDAGEYWETKTLKYDCLHDRALAIVEEVVARRPRTVFDVGCSTGCLTAAIEARLPDTRTFGCDVSQTAIDQISRAEFVRCDLNAEPLPFSGRAFDCITASGICEYVADLPDLLSQVAARLEPHGLFVVSYFNDHHWRRQLRRHVRRPPPRNITWQELVSLPAFEQMLADAGFRIRQRLSTAGRIRPCKPAGRGAVGLRMLGHNAWLIHRLAPQVVYVCRRID